METIEQRTPPTSGGSNTFSEESALIRKLNAEKFNKSVVFNKRIFDIDQASFGTHGIFNPSCVYDGKEVTVIARAESSEATWHGRFITDKATPCISKMKVATNRVTFSSMHQPLSTGMPSPCRPEDWRLFTYKGETWTNFTNYFFYNDGWPQRDVKSRTCLGKIDGNHIRFIKEMEINGPMNNEEKNWVFFEHDGKMKFIYSIEPWQVYTCDDNGNVIDGISMPLNVPRRAPKFLANSTNPILVKTQKWGEVYLMFYHYFVDPLANMGGTRNRTYYQFILIFDKTTLKPIAHTYRPVMGGGMGVTEGRHDNVIYTSGAFARGKSLYALCGEGDTFSQLYRLSMPTIEEGLVEL